jgi:prepilin-type processing-associated H-X9-DG protein
LLVAILLPSLRRAREHSRIVVCSTQIQQLMRATLFYAQDYKGQMVGAAVNDALVWYDYDNGNRTDYLTWFGTWKTLINRNELDTSPAWANAPRGGRLWKYYKDENLLKCPSADDFNGKLSYSTPENVAAALPGEAVMRYGLPPRLDRVKHTSRAIQYLDEDEENGISSYSCEDGFGEGDMFGDRHLGRATVAFFDGHAEAHYFPRGNGEDETRKVRYYQNRSENPFFAKMIQIAPFTSDTTPLPWKWSGRYEDWPPFKRTSNMPVNVCTRNDPAVRCE